MTSNAANKRREYFDRGVAALQNIGAHGAHYLCPICERAFTLDDLSKGRLTIEHVPPGSIGGKGICLTCAECNSAAGHQVDFAPAEIARMARMSGALFKRQGDYEGPIKVNLGETETNAQLKVGPSGFVLEVPESINNPVNFQAQITHLRQRAGTDLPFRITTTFKLGDRALFVSLLRTAYLASFAWFGYRYALSERLDIVRAQIRSPSSVLIPGGALMGVSQQVLSYAEPIILGMSSPHLGVALYLPAGTIGNGPAVCVLLPWLTGPLDFYLANVESVTSSDGKRRFTFEASALGWPTGPQLALDFA